MRRSGEQPDSDSALPFRPPPSESTSRLQTLLVEYQTVSAEMRERIANHTSIVGLGLTAVGGGFVYAVSRGATNVLLFLPVGYAGLLFFALFNATGITLLAGYRRYIEDRVNEALGEDLFVWEQVSNNLRPFGFSTLAFLGFCAGLLLLLIVVALYVLLTRSAWLFSLGLVGGLALCGLLAVGAIRFKDAFRASFDEATRRHGSPTSAPKEP